MSEKPNKTPSPNDTIQEAASKPKSVTVDGQTVVNHSLPDLIKADQYEQRKSAAAKSPFAQIRRAKIPR